MGKLPATRVCWRLRGSRSIPAAPAFEAALLEEVIAEVDSAEFLADLLVFEHGKPDPRICTEAGWAASGFDRFLHGPH